MSVVFTSRPYSQPSTENTFHTVITNVMISAIRKILTEFSIDCRVMLANR